MDRFSKATITNLPGPRSGSIIYLDGPSGGGKTFLGNILRANLPQSFYIPEYTDMIASAPSLADCRLPPADAPLKIHQAVSAIWARIDTVRYDLISRGQENENSTNLVDTSPLMVIGFELVRERRGYLSPLDSILRDYIQSFATPSSSFLIPSFWIFLEATQDTIRERILQRSHDRIHPLLLDSIEFFIDFYSSFRQAYLNSNEFLVIDTGSLSPETAAAKIAKSIPRNNQVSLGMVRFIADLAAARSTGHVSDSLSRMDHFITFNPSTNR